MLWAYDDDDPIDDHPTLPIDEKEIIVPANNVALVACPSCQLLNPAQLVCPYCGKSFAEDNVTLQFVSVDVAAHSKILFMGEAMISRQTNIIFDFGQEWLTLPIAERITLGSAKMPTEPHRHHIDLTPFHAGEKGVSRHHIEICRRETFALLSDLGSTNGTYLNGCRLQPHSERLLRNGDHLQLSKLSLTVCF